MPCCSHALAADLSLSLIALSLRRCPPCRPVWEQQQQHWRPRDSWCDNGRRQSRPKNIPHALMLGAAVTVINDANLPSCGGQSTGRLKAHRPKCLRLCPHVGDRYPCAIVNLLLGRAPARVSTPNTYCGHRRNPWGTPPKLGGGELPGQLGGLAPHAQHGGGTKASKPAPIASIPADSTL